MLRALYMLSVVTLIGASAAAATGIDDRSSRVSAGAGFVLLTVLQRG